MTQNQDWSRSLSRPLRIKDGSSLTTLSDVRAFVLELPEAEQRWQSWVAVTGELFKAADGGDLAAVTEAVERALYLEGWLEK